MTVERKMQALLVQNGMFERQAKAVIVAAKESMLLENEDIRWGSDVNDYTVTYMHHIVWMSVRAVAGAWIELNCPKVWFRPKFIDENEGK